MGLASTSFYTSSAKLFIFLNRSLILKEREDNIFSFSWKSILSSSALLIFLRDGSPPDSTYSLLSLTESPFCASVPLTLWGSSLDPGCLSD